MQSELLGNIFQDNLKFPFFHSLSASLRNRAESAEDSKGTVESKTGNLEMSET